MKKRIKVTNFKQNLKLKQDAPTRWNLTYLMIDRLTELQNPISRALLYFPSAQEMLNRE